AGNPKQADCILESPDSALSATRGDAESLGGVERGTSRRVKRSGYCSLQSSGELHLMPSSEVPLWKCDRPHRREPAGQVRSVEVNFVERRPIHHVKSKTDVLSIICSHVARERPRTESQIPSN